MIEYLINVTISAHPGFRYDWTTRAGQPDVGLIVDVASGHAIDLESAERLARAAARHHAELLAEHEERYGTPMPLEGLASTFNPW